MKKYWLICSLLYGLGLSTLLFAHGEEITISHAPKGPVHLTDEQKKTIALQLAPVTLHTIDELLTLHGHLALLADAQATVTVRISGMVTAIWVKLGDKVRQGQPLAKIQSRLIGNPPPSLVVAAPISGLIDARNISIGDAIEPTKVLFHISDRHELLVIAQVYEEDLSKIKLGQTVTIYPLSYPKQVFTGQLILIAPNLDPLTRTVNVHINLKNPDDLLKPGMFVRANVSLNHNKKALAIPNDALLAADNQQFVFITQGKEYVRVVVEVGASDDHYTEITHGLVAGQQVVTQGNRELYTLWLSGNDEHEDH